MSIIYWALVLLVAAGCALVAIIYGVRKHKQQELPKKQELHRQQLQVQESVRSGAPESKAASSPIPYNPSSDLLRRKGPFGF